MNGLSKTSTAAILGGVGGLAVGGLLGYATAKRSSKKRRKAKNKARKSYRKHRKGKQRTPYTAGKRRDTSTRRIRFTKNGQPYIILKSGKARFIKQSSVRNSRKRRGGKY